MNDTDFKSSLSSKLEFHLEYCWLPVSGRHENFTGFNNDLQNLSQSVEQRSFHFTLATQPFCSLTRILKFETIHTFEFQRLDKEMNLKGKANHACFLVSDLGRLCKLIHLSNSHASLVPEVSNNPIKLRVLNSGLI